LLADHLSQSTWQSLAALLRHADVYDFIERMLLQREADNSNDQPVSDGRWLVSLDNLLAEHYPTRLGHPTDAKDGSDARRSGHRHWPDTRQLRRFFTPKLIRNPTAKHRKTAFTLGW
jgi:hypothetical protein